MKNKNSVIGLALIIAALSAFYLSFTIVSGGINKEITAYADQVKADSAATGNYSDDALYRIWKGAKAKKEQSIWYEKRYLGYQVKEIKKMQLNLGLDLQGGMHATLIINPGEFFKELSGGYNEPEFLQACDSAAVVHKVTQKPYVDAFYDIYNELKKANDPSYQEGSILWEIFQGEDFTVEAATPDTKVIEELNKKLEEAIDLVVVKLRSRIDRFGATQPVILPVKSAGRIEIELPGVDDKARVTKALNATAKLEFLELWEGQEFQQFLIKLNDYITKREAKLNKLSEAATEELTAVEDSEEAVIEDADDNLIVNEEEVEEADEANPFDALAEDGTLEDTGATAAVDSLATPEQQRMGIRRYFDFDARGTGFAVNKDSVIALFNDEQIRAIMPYNMEILWGKVDVKANGEIDENSANIFYFVKRDDVRGPLLDGTAITDAGQDRDDMTGEIVVVMQMDYEGAMEWEKITERKAQTQERIAIVLDDVVYSAPSVNTKISGGRSQISGMANLEEAKDLASILSVGKLPVPTQIDRMVVVGPTLGAESVQRGLFSLGAGLVLVLIFMIAYYNKGGLFADLALVFNIFFIIGILATPNLNTSLTLPGIAGIVLTIGMSIDANVLIFERIREELAAGKGTKGAIASGYSRALWTIIDSNVTTFLTAAVLFVFGTGLIKGFATTLMIGIACSFFSAVYISRLFIEWFGGKKDGGLSFETALSKGLFKSNKINFIGGRKKAYMVSGLVIVAGIGSFFGGGLNPGVEFIGGRSYVVKFENEIQASNVKSELMPYFNNEGTQVKTFDGNDQVKVTTSFMKNSVADDASAQVEAALVKGLTEKFPDNKFEIRESYEVDPTIASDIKWSALESIFIALVLIFLYILVRFVKWQFSLGALIALFHDVLVVLSLFAIFNLIGISFELDEVFIGALLTIVGYSINDTVVVFDRVREFINSKRGNLADTLNQSINSTLSRTLMTSVTTLLVIVVLLIFGGEALRGFSFALLIGVVAGTYSSIFIATPVVLDTGKKSIEAQQEKK